MRAVKIITLTLFGLALIPVLAIALFGGRVARSVVDTLNENLLAEITTENVDIGLLSTFPSLSVTFEGVRLKGSDGGDLLTARQARFLVPLSSLWRRTQVQGMVVQHGTLSLLTDVDGNANYNLTGYAPVDELAALPDSTAEEAVTEFAIDRAVFKDMDLVYRDDQLGIDLTGHTKKFTFSGDFGANQYVLGTEGNLYINYLDREGKRLLSEERLSIDAETIVDDELGSYLLQPLHLRIRNLELDLRGSLQPTPAGLETDLQFRTITGGVEDVIELIPPQYLSSLADLDVTGELDLSGTLTGALTQEENPKLRGELRFKNGRVASPRANLGIRDLDVLASFKYVDSLGGYQSIAVPTLKGTFRKQPFSMVFFVDNIDDPTIRLSADGALPLEALPELLGPGPITRGRGTLKINQVRVNGRYEDMLTPRGMANVLADGDITAENVSVTVNGERLNFPTGKLEFRGNAVAVNNLQFEAGTNQLRFDGQARNFIPVLFAEELRDQDRELTFDLRLSGENLNLDELLELAGPTEDAEEDAEREGTTDSLRAKTIANRTKVTDLLRGSFVADIDAWQYGEIRGTDFTGDLNVSPRLVTVKGTTTAMGGELLLDGLVNINERLSMSGKIAGDQVDVKEFFRQGENFAQEVLTDDNLEGTMTTEVWLEAGFDDQGEFDFDALKVLAHIAIDNGELRDFAMLENFAGALKQKDLARVKFDRLENYFEISEQVLYIPTMFIQSSALNLEIAGQHSFDQDIEYYVKVNAGQVIGNKLKRHNRGLEVQPRKKGWFNLYMTMIGQLETFEVERSKRTVKAAFEASTARRARIRGELARRFEGGAVSLPEFFETVGGI